MLYYIVLLIHMINYRDKDLIASQSQLAILTYVYMDSFVYLINTSWTAPLCQTCAEHSCHKEEFDTDMALRS